MPQGRHRHAPTLQRLMHPTAVAVVGLACAGGAWLVGEAGLGDTDTVVLRGLAAGAALAAVTGAALARRWDRGASRKVAELKAKMANMEWRSEERQAELEGELEESRELRLTLERKLNARRAELTRLRTEHAALLRRYAHAETQRASALEGRRLLELEAGEPAPPRALTAGATDHRKSSGAPTPLTYLQAKEALQHLRRSGERQREAARAEAERDGMPPALPPAPSASPARGTEQPSGSGGFDFFGNAKREPRRPGESGSSSDEEPESEPDESSPGSLDISELRGAIP